MLYELWKTQIFQNIYLMESLYWNFFILTAGK